MATPTISSARSSRTPMHSPQSLMPAGKPGMATSGATVCLRSSHYLEQAWEIARQHRVKVIDAVKNARPDEGSDRRLRGA